MMDWDQEFVVASPDDSTNCIHRRASGRDIVIQARDHNMALEDAISTEYRVQSWGRRYASVFRASDWDEAMRDGRQRGPQLLTAILRPVIATITSRIQLPEDDRENIQWVTPLVGPDVSHLDEILGDGDPGYDMLDYYGCGWDGEIHNLQEYICGKVGDGDPLVYEGSDQLYVRDPVETIFGGSEWVCQPNPKGILDDVRDWVQIHAHHFTGRNLTLHGHVEVERCDEERVWTVIKAEISAEVERLKYRDEPS